MPLIIESFKKWPTVQLPTITTDNSAATGEPVTSAPEPINIYYYWVLKIQQKVLNAKSVAEPYYFIGPIQATLRQNYEKRNLQENTTPNYTLGFLITPNKVSSFYRLIQTLIGNLRPNLLVFKAKKPYGDVLL